MPMSIWKVSLSIDRLTRGPSLQRPAAISIVTPMNYETVSRSQWHLLTCGRIASRFPLLRYQCLDGPDRIGVVPVRSADDLVPHDAAPVHEIGLGELERAVPARHGAVGVQENRQREAVPLEEGSHRIPGALIDAHRQHLEVVSRERPGEPVDRWDLLHTGRAPGRPEMDHHHLAPQFRKAHAPAIQPLQAEVR